MIKKVDLGSSLSHHGVFGNPAPLGLLGLAVSCASITPIALGYGATPDGFATCAVFIVFFGFGCHLLAGLMDFANKNTYGGTIFTAFAFNWMITALSYFAIAFKLPINHHVLLATEILLLIVFLFLTYGFGFFSKALFLFLLDIDLLYICKILRALTESQVFTFPIALFTFLLGLIGLWLALGGLINPLSGKEFFKVGKPVFYTPVKKGFDFSIRRNIFEILYNHWREHAFKEMSLDEFCGLLKKAAGNDNIIPDLYYLMEYGSLNLTFEDENKNTIKSLRLTAGGIDLYEQLILKKYEF